VNKTPQEFFDGVVAERAKQSPLTVGVAKLVFCYAMPVAKKNCMCSPKKILALVSALQHLGTDAYFLSSVWNPGERDPVPLDLQKAVGRAQALESQTVSATVCNGDQLKGGNYV